VPGSYFSSTTAARAEQSQRKQLDVSTILIPLKVFIQKVQPFVMFTQFALQIVEIDRPKVAGLQHLEGEEPITLESGIMKRRTPIQ
jgi:hypothetical protein